MRYIVSEHIITNLTSMETKSQIQNFWTKPSLPSGRLVALALHPENTLESW